MRLVGCALACSDFVEGPPFASIRTREYRDNMARETCLAMLMITSWPARTPGCSVPVRGLRCHGPVFRTYARPGSRRAVLGRWSATRTLPETAFWEPERSH